MKDKNMSGFIKLGDIKGENTDNADSFVFRKDAGDLDPLGGDDFTSKGDDSEPFAMLLPAVQKVREVDDFTSNKGDDSEYTALLLPAVQKVLENDNVPTVHDYPFDVFTIDHDDFAWV
jgi:hypothetical protein